MAELRPRTESFDIGGSLEPSRRSNASTACLNCKARRSKCSSGRPCNSCSRLGIECVYDASLDKRRKIHWERAETESALQQELLHRLLDLIRSDEGVHRRLQDDAHILGLTRRLGVELPEYAEGSQQPKTWPYTRITGRGSVEDDVSQRRELQKRRAIPETSGERDAMETSLSTVTSDQSNLPTPSDVLMTSPGIGRSDARNQYRIFCSSDHVVSNTETISVYGYLTFPATEVQTAYGSIMLRQQQIFNLRIPEYLIQPLLFDEERCPMAAVYTDFRNFGRQKLAEGKPIDAVLGSAKVDLALYLRERQPEDPHTPATWACEFMRLLKDYNVYVSLACIFTYSRFMRWVIAPSAETYALLPTAMRPTPAQRLVRHHPGVDLPIFPEMRDGLILDMRDYIVAIQTLGCSVNWQYGLEAAMDMDWETRVVTVSDRFAEHICDLSNWSVSQRFVEVFPELRGLYRVVEQEIIPVSDVDVEEFLQQRGILDPGADIAAAG